MTTSGTCFRIYIYQEYYQEQRPLAEWLLLQARDLGVRGGTVFKASQGFGRLGPVHEERFVGFPSDYAPSVVEFFLDENRAQALRTLLAGLQVRVFIAQWPAQYEELGAG